MFWSPLVGGITDGANGILFIFKGGSPVSVYIVCTSERQYGQRNHPDGYVLFPAQVWHKPWPQFIFKSMLESKHILHSSERDLLQHTNVFFLRNDVNTFIFELKLTTHRGSCLNNVQTEWTRCFLITNRQSILITQCWVSQTSYLQVENF